MTTSSRAAYHSFPEYLGKGGVTARANPAVRFIGLSAAGDRDGTVLEVAGGTKIDVAKRLEELPEALLVDALVQHADYERTVLMSRAIS